MGMRDSLLTATALLITAYRCCHNIDLKVFHEFSTCDFFLTTLSETVSLAALEMPRYVQSRPTALMAKLLTAIRANNHQVFEQILDNEGLPKLGNAADFKLLKKALIYGRKRMAQTLLEHGCRAYNKFYSGNSPLHLAASRRNCGQLVRRLLDHGGRVDQKNRHQETPLHVAFAFAEKKVVDLMLQQHLRSSFVNESNSVGLSYLHIAASRPVLDNVRCLVEMGNANVNCQVKEKDDAPYAGFTPLHMAVWFDRPKVAELLLNYGANLWARDSEGSTPLHLALECKNVEMIDLLLAHDYKKENYVNNVGLSHFMATCVSNDPNYAVDYLLNPANSKTALIHERVDNYGDNLTYLFKNYTPLHFAAECGRQEIAHLLLSNGASSKTRNTNGLLPEHLALMNNFHRTADLFTLHCLGQDWSPAITSYGYGEENVERVETVVGMICDDDDSGYYENDADDEGDDSDEVYDEVYV